MGYIGYIPSFWMSETWSFAGPDIHLQFAGAEISAEAWHFDWSSPDRLSNRRVHGWIERFIGILNLKQCEHFPDRMCPWLRWQLSNRPCDHVLCRNIVVLSRIAQYKPCEWWLEKKVQNSQCKRVVSVQFSGSDKSVFLNMVFDYSNSFVGAVKPRSKGCSSQTCTQWQGSSGPVASDCSKSLPDA